MVAWNNEEPFLRGFHKTGILHWRIQVQHGASQSIMFKERKATKEIKTKSVRWWNWFLLLGLWLHPWAVFGCWEHWLVSRAWLPNARKTVFGFLEWCLAAFRKRHGPLRFCQGRSWRWLKNSWCPWTNSFRCWAMMQWRLKSEQGQEMYKTKTALVWDQSGKQLTRIGRMISTHSEESIWQLNNDNQRSWQRCILKKQKQGKWSNNDLYYKCTCSSRKKKQQWHK